MDLDLCMHGLTLMSKSTILILCCSDYLIFIGWLTRWAMHSHTSSTSSVLSIASCICISLHPLCTSCQGHPMVSVVTVVSCSISSSSPIIIMHLRGLKGIYCKAIKLLVKQIVIPLVLALKLTELLIAGSRSSMMEYLCLNWLNNMHTY